jgi:hypothetical protein
MSRYIGSSLSVGLLCLIPRIGQAQNTALVIRPGTDLTVTGNALVLRNLDLYCNGSLYGNNGIVWLTGSNNSSYNGTGIAAIRSLSLNTGASSVLSLNSSGLEVSGSLNFQQGLIDLHGFQLQIKGSGSLQGETESTRITGVSGGSVIASASSLNAPNQVNIGNLGAMVTSTANLGAVSIMRVHNPVTNTGHPTMHGIDRAYLIQPAHDAALNATLRFYYLNAELDGNDPTTLSLWRSNDGVHWAQVGFDTRNTTQKYVEKQGQATLSWWTVSSAANPLPLVQTAFKVTCDGQIALVQWETGEESNLDYFEVQRSPDGSEWMPLTRVAATNIPTGSSYAYKDNQPAGSSFYRIAIADREGALGFSPAFSGGCSDVALPLMLYPNPAETRTIAQVSVRQAVSGTLEIMDINGQRVYQAKWNLQPGVNQLSLPVYGLAGGNYVVRLMLPGALPQQVQLLKK